MRCCSRWLPMGRIWPSGRGASEIEAGFSIPSVMPCLVCNAFWICPPSRSQEMSTCPAFRHRIRALPSGSWFPRVTKRMASFTCPAVRAGIPSRPTTARGTARGHTVNQRPSFQSRLHIASRLIPACCIKAARTKRRWVRGVSPVAAPDSEGVVLEGVGRGGSVRQLFLVFLGSGFGGGARYLLGGWFIHNFGVAFPVGTVAINAIGSFLVGLIMHLSLSTTLISSDLRLTLTTGVLGGFTTYSTFNYETISLFQQGAALLGALNLLVTVVLCLIAGAAGLLLGRWWVPV